VSRPDPASNAAPAPAPSPARLGTLLALAWPVILSRSTQSVVGLSDSLMTAPLGEAALAAATTGAFNTFAVIILPMGVAFIVQSFAAQLFGRGDLVAARRYAWYGLGLAAIALLGGAAATPFVGAALGLFHEEPVVHATMTGYVTIRLASVGAVVATEALGNWFAGLGNTRIQMRASVVTMVTNIVLNWVLIYGKLGLPAMGVNGAALASTLASWIGLAVVLWAFGARQREIAPGAPLALRGAEFFRMLRFGLPNGLNWFLEFAAFILFINAIVGDLGTTVLAAFNVIMSINSVSFMPAFGLATAGAVLAGQAIGAGRPNDVWPVVRLTAIVAMVWQGTVGLFYLLFPGPFMSAFAPPGSASEMLRVGTAMLAISGAWQAFDALGLTFGESLRAAGDTTWCMWARLGIAWFVFFPVAYVFVTRLGGGADAAMWCVVFYLACLAATLVLRFRSGAWRRIRLTGEELPVG
jgi:MATE family multidrug resistance protein